MEDENHGGGWKWKLKLEKQFFRPSSWWGPGFTYSVTCAQLLDNDLLVTGCLDKTVRIWDLAPKNRCRNVIFGHTGTVRCLWSHGGKLASSGDDCRIRVTDLTSGKLQYSIERHSDRVVAMQMDDELLVAGSNPREVHVFSAGNGDFRGTVGPDNFHTGTVWTLRFQGDRLVTGSSDCTVRVSSLTTGSVACTLAGHTRSVSAVTMSEDLVASAGVDGLACLWDLRLALDKRAVAEFREASAAASSVSLDDGKMYVGYSDETVRCYDLSTRRLVKECSVDADVLALHASKNRLAVATKKSIFVFGTHFVQKKRDH